MRREILALAGIVLLGVAIAAPARADSTPAIGIVDMERVGKEYKGFEELQGKYQKFAQDQQDRFNARQKVMMLNEADYTKYFDLVQAGAPTDANKKTISDLETLASTRQSRLKELVALKDRDTDQQKEYDELSKLYSLRMAELKDLDDSLMKEVQQMKTDLTKQADTQVEAAVKAVAEQKKLSMVFVKAAILYGATDITDDVLTKLNAAAPAPAPEAPAPAPAPAAPAR